MSRLSALSSLVITLMVLASCTIDSYADTDETKGLTPPAVSREMIWNADRQTVQAARQKCGEFSFSRTEECFADAMQSLGASNEAVSFARSHGAAFVRRFREAGRVDIAYLYHPYRANENYSIVLVNGEPSMIDVDDMSLLQRDSMEQDKAYGAIRKAFPRVTLWPGDRSPKYPLVEFLADGGQSFIVPYTLRNFCHACETLGTAFFSFDFNKSGRFLGARFLRVEGAPKKPVPKSEPTMENEQIRFVVMVEEGKEFAVRLPGNRTTGYHWRPIAGLDERTVKLVRNQYVPLEGGGAGAGGDEIWTFLAVSRGEAEITMEYARPWEKGQSPAKTATIKVSVRPATQK